LVARIKARIEELRASAPVIVVDAALLPEWDARPWLDVVVVVDSDEGRSIERLASGGRRGEADVRARMAHQFSRQKKAAYADVLIPNHGSLDELRQRACAAFRALVETDFGSAK
jgi:dephospho-CoA kinase